MSEPWIKYKYRIIYKTEHGSGMVIVKAHDEHQARHVFCTEYGMRYRQIEKIERVEE